MSYFLGTLFIGVLFATIPSIVLAQCTDVQCTEGFCPLACVQGSKLAVLYENDDSLANFFSNVFRLALTVGGVLAVFRIAWAGYLYMITDLWSSKERARETLRETVLGLLLLIAVYVILNQINPDILRLDILDAFKEYPVQAE